MLPIAAAPTKPTIQIRPLSQMQPQQQPFIAILPNAPLPVQSQPPLPVPVPPPIRTQLSYTCSFCNTKQTSQENLIKHLSQHVNFGGSNPNSSDMEKGYMSFKTPSVVQNGLWKTKFMCLSCGKMFGKEQQVKIHLNVHYGDNIYNCRFCEKVFANYNTFEEHVKSHSEEYKFHCKFCNASFINRNVMVSHQRACAFSTDPISKDPTTSTPD